ncbi:Rrf2 family transcriptional regulator [Vibrio sp. DW001]|uniref:RrF2 family transcriptional regulator n=1 Tax=Vibrio sp. DW001 TaxID=2912315 RepID=UPI0023B12559|nr:Rrf2 family transcriptional regulator [Vibrio sp. DW001]WED28495.1 Rrf2 family transcriptional regulator [Vibrio sp. DW001]
MRVDSRLSRVIHVLLHLSKMQEVATSETISKMLNTNPAVVRRTMSGLRNNGYVESTKGHRGGWKLTKSLNEITLLGLYNALDIPHLFAIGAETNTSTCLVEKIANESVDLALKSAKKVFLMELENVTLQQLSEEFEVKYEIYCNSGE